jgi:tetratricopeptide (TPR) repeat protein
MFQKKFMSSAMVLGASVGLALTVPQFASANFDPAPADCSKFKKGSKEWKQCTGSVKPGDGASPAERFTYAYWLAKTGAYAQALEILRALPDQNDTGVLTMTGYATRHLGNVDEALGLYGRALAINPNLSNTRQYLGEAYLQKNDVAKAKIELAEIARICGSDACVDYRDLAREIAAHEAKG